jgi:hypothetical protein
MKHWIIGIVLAVIALGLLYGAAALSQTAPTTSALLLAAFAVAVIGEFAIITLAGKRAAAARVAAPVAAPAAAAAGHPAATGPSPWSGTGATLGVALIGLVGLLVYLGIYVGAWAHVMGWLVWVGVALSFLMLGVVVLLTAGRTD